MAVAIKMKMRPIKRKQYYPGFVDFVSRDRNGDMQAKLRIRRDALASFGEDGSRPIMIVVGILPPEDVDTRIDLKPATFN
jgi:hypothetical protein